MLQASRAVQGDLAEALAQRRHPPLQLSALGRPERQRERGPQHRRVRGGLQDRLVLARQLAVLLGQDARAARALELLAVGVLDVEDALSHLPERLAVADPLRVEDGVDREPGAFGRPEEKLGGAGELGFLGERAGAEEGLKGGALLGLDDERGRLAGVLGSGSVGAAPEVALERLIGRRAVRRADRPARLAPNGGRAPARRPRGRRRGGAATAARGSRRAAGRSPRSGARRCAARPPPAPPARRRRSAQGRPTPASSSTRRLTRPKERSAPGPPSPSASETAR